MSSGGVILPASGGSSGANTFLSNLSSPTAVNQVLNMGGNTVTGLPDPVSPSDAATMAYALALAQGVSPKASVVAATTAALAANTYANGTAGVGATLTANANGALAAVDGVTLTAGQRLLVKNEVSGLKNGIYSVTQVGSAGTPYILTRTIDADTCQPAANPTVVSGIYCFVVSGTVNAQQAWALVTADPITLGTTALTFSQFFAAGEYTFSSGVQLTGNAVSANVDNSSIAVSGSQLIVKNSGVTNAKLANMADQTIKGNNSGGSAAPLDLTATQVNTLLGTTGAATSVGAFGSTPNTAGASLTSQVLTLQPADATHPGGVSTGAQSIAGQKTVVGSTDAVQLSVQANGTQTSNLQTWASSAPAVLAYVTGDGRILTTAVGDHTNKPGIGLDLGSGNFIGFTFDAGKPVIGGMGGFNYLTFNGSNGQTGVGATFNIGSTGSATDPAMTIGSDAHTGIYRPGTSQLSIAVNSKQVVQFNTTGMALQGSTSGAVTIAVPATVTPYTVTLPSAQAAGVMSNDGSGNVSFSAGAARQLLTGATASTQPTWTAPVGSFSTKTSAYPMVVGDYFLNGDATSAGFTITLPSPATAVGLPYQIKKIDSTFNAVTITHNASETIDGANSITLNTQYECVVLVSDGTNWTVISRRTPSQWTSYSPTIGGTVSAPTVATGSTLSAYWKRIGDSVQIRWEYSQSATTGAAAGSGDYLFPLPSGITINSSVANTSPSLCGTGVGAGSSLSNADTQRVASIEIFDASNVRIMCNTGGTGYVGSAFHNFNGNATVRFGFIATLPISGWNG